EWSHVRSVSVGAWEVRGRSLREGETENRSLPYDAEPGHEVSHMQSPSYAPSTTRELSCLVVRCESSEPVQQIAALQRPLELPHPRLGNNEPLNPLARSL